MRKLYKFLLLFAVLLAPWATRAQDLSEYTFSTGTDASKWVDMSSATQILSPSASDGLASSLQSIGFSFPFGEDSYTQFSVNTDGNLRLGSTVTGTGSYATPFSSSYANQNHPKINAFGCDGYGVSGSHYVKSMLVGDSMRVVEFCMGTYTSSTRNELYKWQIQLHTNGDIDIVFPGTSDLPTTNPATSHQCGLCINANDGWVISSSSNTATHFTNGSSTTNATGTWFDANRYYRFAFPVYSCPRPLAFNIDSAGVDYIATSWSAGGEESAWLVYLDGVIVDQVTTPEYTFTDLDLNTMYTIGVAAYCAVDDTSRVVTASMRTLAGEPINTFPYFCGFEIDEDNNVNEASAWVLENGTQSNYWMVGTNTYNSGNRSMYITNDGTTNGYSVTSASYVFAYATFQLAAGSYAYSFDWKANGESSYDFIRAAMVPASVEFTAGDYNGFDNSSAMPSGGIAIDGAYRMNLQANWQTKSGEFIIPAAGLYKMVFMWRNDGSSGSMPPAAIDNINLAVNTCPRPQELTATYVSPDSITVTWVAGGNETSWVISNGNETYVTNNNTYTFDELNPNTPYNITVRGICGVDDTSMATALSVRTACGLLVELPMFEDFEAQSTGSSTTGSVFVPCWNRINNGTSYGGYPYVGSSSSYNHTTGGSKGIYWYNTTTTGTYGDYQYMVLPGLDTNALPINTVQLSFWAKASSSSYHPVLYVGVMSDPTDITTFTSYDTINVNPGSSTVWDEFTTIFNHYEGTGNYIAIKAVRPTSTWTVYLDDVKIDSIPSCLEPEEFTALSTTQADSIVVNWLGDENSAGYELVVGPTGCNPDTITNVISVYDTIYTFTDLLGGISYDAYVRTNCGGEYSHWEGPLTFTPGMYVIGLSGSDTLHTCGGAIYDDGGPTGNYSDNANFTLVVYPTTPDSLIAFHGTAYTEGSIDYLRIYDGVGTNGTPLWQTSSSSQLDQIPHTLSTSGPITLLWHTDGSIQYQGFEVFVSCEAAPECFPATDVTASNISGTSAYLSWNAPTMSTPTEYDLEVYSAGQMIQTLQVTGTNTFLSGLNPGVTYKVLVRSVCEDNSVSPADSVTFATTCLGGGDVVITAASSSNSFYPVNQAVAYSYTQTIYNASYFNGASAIRGIAYNVNGTTSNTRQIDIYMAEINSNQFHANSSYVAQDPVLLSDLTLMYSGTYTPNSTGWHDIMFDSTFNYTGAGNLVVAFYDHTGSTGSSGTHWTLSGSDTISIHYHNSSAINLAQPVGSTQRVTCVRPDIKFYVNCDTTLTCVGPNVMISSIGGDEVSLTWAPGMNETSWEVAHREASATTWTVDAAAVTTTSYTFTNLDPNTEYQFRVTSDCDEDAYTIVSATTACEEHPVPFFENFESFPTATTSPLPNCWYKNTNYSTSYPYASTSYHLSGTKAMYMYSTSSTWSYMVLPMFAPSIDSLMVSFWLYKSNTSYSHRVVVGVMTDPTNPNTFVQVASVSPSTVSTWEAFEIPLSSYTGTGRYIALMSPDGEYSYPYLDDLAVDRISSCPRVTDVTATNITQTSATIAWATTNANSYELEYGPAGFTLGTGTTVTVPLGDSTYTITGLTANTAYEVFVRGICGTEQGNWSFAYNFRTLCGMIDVLPYFEGFESYATGSSTTGSAFIPCWTRLNNGTSYGGYPYVSSSSTYNHTPSGTKGLYWYGSTTATTYGDYQYIILPQIDTVTLPLNTLQLSFWARSSSTSYSPSFQIGYMNSVTDTAFTVVGTANPSTEWTEYVTDFSSYTPSGASFVAIRALRPSSSWYAYVDDVTLELAPLCPRVVDITATNVLTQSATISWTDTSSTNTQWYLEYDDSDFTPGSGVVTPILVNDTFYTITGLDSGTVYHVYVYPNCNGDVFARHYTFTTLASAPASVPYSCDFEAAGVNGWDLLNTNQSNYWIVGNAVHNGGSRSLYVTDNGTANSYSGSESYSFATRTFNLNAGEYIYSYDWKCNGESSFDFIRAALVPAGTQLTPGNYSGFNNESAMPAGAIALDGGYRMNLQTTWQTQSGTFQIAQAGTYTMVFLWRNDGSVYNMPPAAIDNVNLIANTCPQPAAIHSAGATVTSIDVDWTDLNNPIGWQLEYGLEGFTRGQGTSMFVTSHPVTLSNLDTATTYDIYVRPICAVGDTGLWAKVTLMSGICDGMLEYTTGTATSTSYYAPLNNFYNYTMTQTIIDSAELAQAGFAAGSAISSIAYSYTYSSASTAKTDVSIWMQHTNKSVFASSSDYDSLRADAVMVYTGSLNCSQGWNTFMFQDTLPFTWDGQSNIMIIVDDNSGDYDGSSYTFNVTASSGYKTLIYYSDSYNPVINNPSDLNSYSGTKTYYQYRPTLKLISCGNSMCSKPSGLVATNVTYSGATINWAGSATDYEIAYKAANEGLWSQEIAVSGTTYTYNTLMPNTEYQVRVRAICDATEEIISDWATTTFTTNDLPCFAPSALTCDATTLSTATLHWTAGTSETEWNIHVWNSGFDTVYHANSNPYTVAGLTQTTTYNVAVSALCGGILESEYSDTIQMTTQTCPVPGNPSASNVTTNSAVISWTGSAQSYIIEYGQGAFGEGQGIATVEVNGTTYTINGLNPETQYSALVRAKCDNVNLSGWSNRAVFTTETEGIDAVDGLNVNIYPNPTSGNTTITLSGVNGMVNIAIVDLNGRTVRSEALSCEGDCAHQLEVSGLASGAYFVRISGDGVNSVKKLVVK